MEKEDIFNDIYARKFQAVKSLCKRYVDEETAAQLAQDSFLNLYKNLENFRYECKLETWLYKITKHICFNHVRMLRTEKRCAPTYSLDDRGILYFGKISFKNNHAYDSVDGTWLKDRRPIFTRNIEAKEILNIVKAEIEKMPTRYKECLLAFIEPDGICTYAEAASKLNIRKNTSRSRLSRARTMLREKMKRIDKDGFII